MADFVRYELEDGTEVYFETAESSLVSKRSDTPEVTQAGRLGDRLHEIAAAAAEVSAGFRERLGPDELELTFGVKVSGKVNFWFFARADGESTMQVKLTWKSDGPAPASGSPGPAARPGS